MIRMIPRSAPRRRALLVLAGVAGALAVPVLPTMPLPVAAATCLLICLCIWVAYVDLIRFSIPDLANLSIFVLGAATIVGVAPVLFLPHLIAAITVIAAMWIGGEVLYHRLGKDALGMGDAKLLGAGMMWVGIASLPSLLLVAAVTGIAYAFLAGRLRKGIPFGPFLALGLLVVWLYGPVVI